ncbi:hypothetical protein OAB81_00665 [Flavobacteriaceae bacterium]|nr:hypothetical protein [Flavobacteriaceae bacterium]
MKPTSFLNIGIDLCQNLQLYNIPKDFIDELSQKFPLCKIYFLNCENESKNIPYEKINIYFGNRISKNIYDKLKNLKWIHFGSVGVNRLNDINFNNKIKVTNSSGMMTRSVSIHALSFILAFSRGVNYSTILKEKKDLTRKSYDSQFNFTSDLVGEKIAIFGRGLIGNDLNKILTFLGADVTLFGRDFFNSNNYNLLKNFNYYVNILPLDKSSEKKFDKIFFNSVSVNSVFINIGRGETVDENALLEALDLNKIRAAALDVFDSEPLKMSNPLLNYENVLLTPHIAGLHNKYWSKQKVLFLENLRRFIANTTLLNKVN